MLTTVEGIYKDGKIELKEAAPRAGPVKVLVTFLPEAEQTKPTFASLYGVFAGDRVTNEEDFKLAEWRPTEEELDSY